MSVVLMGMKHSGKSTVAKGIADRLGWRAIDTDEALMDLHERRTGRRLSCREIFRELGADGWASLEAQALAELSATLSNDARDAAIALGGRTAMNPNCRESIRTMGTLVLLEVEPDELYRRIVQSGLPPFLDTDDPRGSFDALLTERLTLYRSLADVRVNCTDRTPDECVTAVLRAVDEDTLPRRESH
jgi:shikimate kinase